MPSSFDDLLRMPPSLRLRPTPPATPTGARGPGELQIIILMPNDPAGQDLALRIFRAIKQAHQTWQSAATLVGVVVDAVTATGGMVVGPPLGPLIAANAAGKNDAERKAISAVASVVGSAWISYTDSIRVPGLPWYPAFAAVASPIAPPTPNVPMPVLTLTQVTVLLSSQILKAQIMARLAQDKTFEKVIDAVLSAFASFFFLWQVKTLVTNVLGTGPVPSFAPPFVPVGPVVGGTATMIPGGFL